MKALIFTLLIIFLCTFEALTLKAILIQYFIAAILLLIVSIKEAKTIN